MDVRTVLLVDDDSDSLTIYSIILEHHGLRVLHAGNAEDGFRMACAERPDLVVTELFLRTADGDSLAERLKKDPRTGHLPVVAISALITYASHPGYSVCDSYLPKPCIPSRMLEEVQRYLDGSLEPLA